MSSPSNRQLTQQSSHDAHSYHDDNEIDFDPPPADYYLMRPPTGMPDPDGIYPTDSDDNDYPPRGVPAAFGAEVATHFLNDVPIPAGQFDDESDTFDEGDNSMQTYHHRPSHDTPLETSQSEKPGTTAHNHALQDQPEPTQAASVPCYAHSNPAKVEDIFCRRGPTGSHCDNYSNVQLNKGSIDFVTSFLSHAISPHVAWTAAAQPRRVLNPRPQARR